MSDFIAKPFLKWAGGKSQLLADFENIFPKELKHGKIDKYFEPFIGSGAVFFHIAQYYSIRSYYISDINPELVITYKVIQKDVDTLIKKLKRLVTQNLEKTDSERKDFFYSIRERYNKKRNSINLKKYSSDWITRASQIIFLNKTCYNGLFRFNRKGEFNAPFGRYSNPKVFVEENLRKIATILKKTTIKVEDFTKMEKHVTKNSFIYFDPPYRPISKTSNFTGYSPKTQEGGFDDREQVRLSNFFRALDSKDAKIMLSNSDPKNIDPDDNFFEEHYKGFNIDRILARRLINCKSSKRGPIHELVITNY